MQMHLCLCSGLARKTVNQSRKCLQNLKKCELLDIYKGLHLYFHFVIVINSSSGNNCENVPKNLLVTAKLTTQDRVKANVVSGFKTFVSIMIKGAWSSD